MNVISQKLSVLTLFVLLLSNLAWAQQGTYDNANNPGLAKEKYALLSDNLQFKDYEAARPVADWLLENEPTLSENMYIKAIKVYGALEKKAEEEAEKEKLQDRLLEIYDLRLQNSFYDSADYYRYKGYKLYPFTAKRTDNAGIKNLYTFYRAAFAANQANTPRPHLTYLTALMCNAKALNVINTDEMMALYDEIEEVFAYNIENEKPSQQKKWIAAKERVDAIALGCLDIDCDFVTQKLCPKLEQDPDNADLAKKIVKYSISAKCTDNPCYFKGLEALNRLEPTCGLSRKVGTMYITQGEVEKGIAAFERAAEELCTRSSDKAEAYYDLADLLARKGRLRQARSYALKAAKNGKAEAYAIIGNMYMNSFSSCGETSAEVKSNPVKTQAVYLAAYEMFQKAGDQQGMSRAAARFPTAEQIFTQGLQEGDKVSLDHCWIEGSYTIRKR